MTSETPERRSRPRRRVLQNGLLVFSPIQMTRECLIRETSSAGATISVPAPEEVVPPIYLLSLAEGWAYACEPRWKRGERMGLKLVEALDIETPKTPIEHVVRRLRMAKGRF